MSNQVIAGTTGAGGAPFLLGRSEASAPAAKTVEMPNPNTEDRKRSRTIAQHPSPRLGRAFATIKQGTGDFRQDELFGSLPAK
jgi:hypothetical protein